MPEPNTRLIVQGIKPAEKEFQRYVLERVKAEKESRGVEKELEEHLRQVERELKRG